VKLALDDYVDEQEHRITTGKKVERKKALLLLPALFLGKWGKANGYGGMLFSRPDAFEYYTARLQEVRAVAAWACVPRSRRGRAPQRLRRASQGGHNA
jgi:hypothetical protein